MKINDARKTPRKETGKFDEGSTRLEETIVVVVIEPLRDVELIEVDTIRLI